MAAKEGVMWSALDPDRDLHGLPSPQDLANFDCLGQLPVLCSEALRGLGPAALLGGEGHAAEEDWPHDDESTVDVASLPDPRQLYEVSPLVCPTGPPTRGNFSGVLDFEVQVNGENTHKRKYTYSHRLNRIYVDMSVGFPVQFKWDWGAAGQRLLVRATTVFSDESQAEKRVERCLQHVHPSNNNAAGDVCHHVLQSTRPPGTDGVFYSGAHAEPLSWFSVAVAFPPRPDAGAKHFAHAYTFLCKNTCSSGINRRAIEVIFTLEDFSGTVYGRQAVGARVCSCPRRDQKKDEGAAGPTAGKRRRAAAAPAAKRVKLEAADDEDLTVYTLPQNLPIVGRKTFEAALNLILHYQLAGAAQAPEDLYQIYAQPLQKVQSLLDQLRSGERE